MSRALLRDSAIYTGGVFLARALNFLLIPIYSRYLTPSEYGILAVLIMILQGTNYLCLLGVNVATTRLYFAEQADDRYRRALFGHATLLLLIIPTIILLPVVPISAMVANTFLDIPFIPFILPTLVMGLFTPIIQLMNSLLTIQKRSISYGVFHLCWFLVQSISIVVALAFLGDGLRGQVIAQLFSNAIFGGVALVILLRYAKPQFSAGLTKPLLGFGIPLLPSFVCIWIDSGAGRFALEAYSALSELGIFLLASQFAGIVGLLATSVEKALLPYFLRAASRENAPHELGTSILRFIGSLTLLATSLILFAPTVIVLISTPAYFESIQYVAPLTLAALLYAVRLPIAWSLTHSQHPGHISMINGVASITLVALLMVMLGNWGLGIMGVAYATIVVNCVVLIVGTTTAQFSFRIVLPMARLVGLLCIPAICWLFVPVRTSSVLEPTILARNTVILIVAAVMILALSRLTDIKQLFHE